MEVLEIIDPESILKYFPPKLANDCAIPIVLSPDGHITFVWKNNQGHLSHSVSQHSLNTFTGHPFMVSFSKDDLRGVRKRDISAIGMSVVDAGFNTESMILQGIAQRFGESRIMFCGIKKNKSVKHYIYDLSLSERYKQNTRKVKLKLFVSPEIKKKVKNKNIQEITQKILFNRCGAAASLSDKKMLVDKLKGKAIRIYSDAGTRKHCGTVSSFFVFQDPSYDHDIYNGHNTLLKMNDGTFTAYRYDFDKEDNILAHTGEAIGILNALKHCPTNISNIEIITDCYAILEMIRNIRTNAIGLDKNNPFYKAVSMIENDGRNITIRHEKRTNFFIRICDRVGRIASSSKEVKVEGLVSTA